MKFNIMFKQLRQAVLKMLPLITAHKAPSKCARFEKLVGIFSSRRHVDAKNDSVSTQLTRMQPGAILLVTGQLPVTNWRKSFKSLTSALSRNERSIWMDLFEALLLSSPGNCSRFFTKSEVTFPTLSTNKCSNSSGCFSIWGKTLRVQQTLVLG